MKQMKMRSKFNIIDQILYFLCFYAVHMTCKRGTANAFVLPARKAVRSFDTSRMLFNKKDLDRGFNILENASKIVPQGQVVSTAKSSLNFIWKRMMAELAPQDKKGSYSRPSYNFNGRIGSFEFPDEPGRYHIYLGNPCPWCHRAKLALSLRNITPDEIGCTQLIDDPVKASRGGWVFSPPSSSNKNSVDPLGCSDLRELYDKLKPNYKGRCTAPLLIDKKTRKIVSNESADIVRMMNSLSFGENNSEDGGSERYDLYPEDLTNLIDETNEWTYQLLNNGVYRCGFSTTQEAYDNASADVRNGMEKCESILSNHPFLCGDKFTEADLRLLPTLLRFDGVYVPLFRAGGAHIRTRDFPNLHSWLKRCWDLPGVKDTIDMEDANASYYKQLFPLNPGGLIPMKVTAKEIGLE